MSIKRRDMLGLLGSACHPGRSGRRRRTCASGNTHERLGVHSHYPDTERMTKYRSLFGIPETIVPFAFVCLGWPEQPGKPEDRFQKDRVKYERW